MGTGDPRHRRARHRADVGCTPARPRVPSRCCTPSAATARLTLLGSVFLLLGFCHSGCGSGPRTAEPLPDSQEHVVTGSERLAWNQEAPGALEIARYTYGAYVDGERVTLAGHACSSWRAASGSECSAPLPALQPGSHVIELVALLRTEGHLLESPRSPPLRVRKVASVGAAGALAAGGQGTGTFALEGIEYRAETVIRGLTAPVALAFPPDGRVMVAERAGVVRVFDQRTGAVREALGPDDLPSAGPVTVHALVLHPDFRVNRLVFLLYTAPDPSGAVMRLTRLREIGGTLGEAVVLLDGVPSSGADATGALSFGRDGKLYVATNDADQPLLADDIGAFSGKVLRLNEDGTTPDDSGAHTPVFAGGVHQPVGVGALGALSRNGGSWLVDRSDTQRPAVGGRVGRLCNSIVQIRCRRRDGVPRNPVCARSRMPCL